MRKDVSKLIKKTENWLHRKNGDYILELPAKASSDTVSTIKMFGNYTLGPSAEVYGVGNYDEETGKYKIALRCHGKNVLSGIDYANAHMNAGVTNSTTLSDTYYTAIYNAEKDGTVFLDKSKIRFKENTVYSLCAYFWYSNTSFTDRNFGICFDYSDGTSSQMRIPTKDYRFYYCIPSEEGKTIVSISSDADSYMFVRISIVEFGIFEGKHTDFNSVFEKYDGENTEILIEKPLLRIGNSMDEFDLSAGIIKRKINSVYFNAETGIEESDIEGIFKIFLSKPMRKKSSFISLYEKLSLSELTDAECGIAEGDDGTYVYLKDTNLFTDKDTLREYLTSTPMAFTYVLQNAEYEQTSVSIPYREGMTTIEVLTDVAPRKFYAEYA